MQSVLSWLSSTHAFWWLYALLQLCALLILLARLAPGRNRLAPVAPNTEPRSDTSVTVIVPTLNEAKRIDNCLAGLALQTAPLVEVLVVDSRSTDGTRDIVEHAVQLDKRIRLITDPPLPDGWVGKVWALETGLREACGEWVLGIDADTAPMAGLVGGVIAAAELGKWDVVSFSPLFEGQTAMEQLVQPAMLVTLIYRTGAAGAEQKANRVLANGQCFLVRRSLLEANGGYSAARTSFSDDVTLARYLAARGARVGFLDGSRLYAVRAYQSLGEMWREWGRSFDLQDSTALGNRWLDVALIWLVQALPLPQVVAMGLLLGGVGGWTWFGSVAVQWVLAVQGGLLLLIRLSMLRAIAGSYSRRGVTYWLSWLSDIPAALRLTLSMLRRPRVWRGRRYG